MHSTYLWSLVVFNKTAHGALGSTERSVEHVDESGLFSRALLEAETDVEGAGLVVGTVGARYELLVLALEWEPCLEVVLDRSGIVQCARHNADDTVWDLKRLVEFTSDLDHRVEHGGGLLGVTDNELGSAPQAL